MPDGQNPKRSLSEISHLFLSSIREKQQEGGSGARPQRIGPKSAHTNQANPPTFRHDTSIDLTPEEFAGVLGESTEPTIQGDLLRPHSAPVSAVLASHLNGKQLERVKEYARHLAGNGSRVGLIEVDASEFRLMCFDRNNPTSTLDQSHNNEVFDPRQMAEAIEELGFDIDQWLLLLPNPRTPEAKALLRQVDHWILLATCDHDGVVSCYRTLKGLADLHRPRLSLALLDAQDQGQAGKVFRKISSVCEQFLHWPMDAENPVLARAEVSEHLVMHCRSTGDKAQHANAPQWEIVSQFLTQSTQAGPTPNPATPNRSHLEVPLVDIRVPTQSIDSESTVSHLADVVIPTSNTTTTVHQPVEAMPNMKLTSHPDPMPHIRPSSETAAVAISSASPLKHTDTTEVVDLTDASDSEASILNAVLRHAQGEFIECPVKAPMCPAALLTVSRDHRLVLHAVTRQGLSDLRSIGQAYRWLSENRALIAMAIPQFAIDTHAQPSLRLLVDHADLSADLMQPLLQSGNVLVQSYRKLKWAGKLGLLLEAA